MHFEMCPLIQCIVNVRWNFWFHIETHILIHPPLIIIEFLRNLIIGELPFPSKEILAGKLLFTLSNNIWPRVPFDINPEFSSNTSESKNMEPSLSIFSETTTGCKSWTLSLLLRYFPSLHGIKVQGLHKLVVPYSDATSFTINSFFWTKKQFSNLFCWPYRRPQFLWNFLKEPQIWRIESNLSWGSYQG